MPGGFTALNVQESKTKVLQLYKTIVVDLVSGRIIYVASEMKNTSNWDYTHCMTVVSLEMLDEPKKHPRFLLFMIVKVK